MARPQQFERDDVLDKALQVFWEKGFECTSVQDLVDATGLNRGSIYLAFGDKAQLFSKVIERYSGSTPVKHMVEAARDTKSPLDPKAVIKQFFDDLVERALSDQQHKGCLLTNTSAGFYGCNETTAEWVREAFKGLESTITTLVKRGQSRGTITSNAKPRAIARALVASAQGLNILARSGGSAQALKDIATLAVRVLDD